MSLLSAYLFGLSFICSDYLIKDTEFRLKNLYRIDFSKPAVSWESVPLFLAQQLIGFQIATCLKFPPGTKLNCLFVFQLNKNNSNNNQTEPKPILQFGGLERGWKSVLHTFRVSLLYSVSLDDPGLSTKNSKPNQTLSPKSE